MADELAEYEAQLRDSKFFHLLKPIKDLSENWTLDIAKELDEYLGHLDRTGFSFDGGPSLDFAEAALLIQSSACVYSKKVEYLHSLVYQALEVVRTKKRKEASGEDGAEEGMPEGEGMNGAAPSRARNGRNRSHHDEDDSIEAFLAAGEDLVECTDIDLDVDAISAAPVYRRAPAILLALEDGCGYGSGGDGDSGLYRLSHCHVHISGALLLDPRDGEQYDHLLRNVGGRPSHASTAYVPSQLGPWLPDKQKVEAQGAAQAAIMPQKRSEEEEEDDDNGGGALGGEDEDEVEGTSVPADTGSVKVPEGTAAVITTASDQPTQAPAANQVPNVLVASSEQLAQLNLGGGSGTLTTCEAMAFDPFAPLDPNEQSNLPLKPMQVRKPGKAKQAACFAKQRGTGGGQGSSGVRSLFNPSSVPFIPSLMHQEFAYAAELMPISGSGSGSKPVGATDGAGRRVGVQGYQAGLGGGTGSAAEARTINGRVPQPGAVFDWFDAAAATVAPVKYEDVGDEEGVGTGHDLAWGPAEGADDEDDEDDVAGAGGVEYNQLDNHHGVDASDIMAGMRGAHMLRSFQLEDGEGEEDGGQSYEELCRSHIDKMIAAATAKEVQTELAQRVTTWRSRIDPVLKEEEFRQTFDLQHYGEKILGRLQEEGGLIGQQTAHSAAAVDAAAAAAAAVLDFSQVAGSELRFEVSRTFAAMLQLINNRNVFLSQKGGPDKPFKICLLTAEQPHKKMAQKLAAPQASVVLKQSDDLQSSKDAADPLVDERTGTKEGTEPYKHDLENANIEAGANGNRLKSYKEERAKSSENMASRRHKKARGVQN
ncbi:hypothetical protein CEUSTIGMA_g11529.t1 [Chlamydomonas eustigma]|uniref:Condensin-2 complex subunit H2 n=1 Tax=Chlamydomonas eustigma TaxID=1157962 RepID=A0A250XM57_9CHLO|nr:hypothetical protein CEUSTIGMA_g11529.t1 [Chlamydomonas eustigma]|eukprot:GAX84106.1 hypothetical protein CEUSTIGMA_g11529.t1 [Chlamydomonas eustigma]